MISSITDGGNAIKCQYSMLTGTITAAAAGQDNTKLTGESIDRKGFGSCQVAVPYHVTLTSTKKATLSLEISDSANNSNWNTAVPLLTAVDMETAEGATKSEYNLALDLSGYERYIKIATTVDLTATGTDTILYGVVVALGGAKEVPTL